MPYIKADDGRREALRNEKPALSAGELNYQIFYYIKHAPKSYYFYNNIKDYYVCEIITNIKKFIINFLGDKPNYQRYNDMTGALIRCYKEIERRLNIDVKDKFIDILEDYDDEIANYEDTKIISNGDVE